MGRKPRGNRTKNKRKAEARKAATDVVFEPKGAKAETLTAKEGEALRAFIDTVPDEDIRAYAIELARVAAMGVGILRFIEARGEVDPQLLDYTDKLMWQPLKVSPNVNNAIHLGLRDIAAWFEGGLPQAVIKEEGTEVHTEGQPEVPPASDQLSTPDQPSTEEDNHAVNEGRASEKEEVADVGQERDREE